MSSTTKTLIIDNREYQYEEVPLYHGQKKINKKIAKENLLLLHPILESSNIKYGLFFGTLLGAIRENDIIEHDEDIDIYLLAEDRDIFLKNIFKLDEIGLKLIRNTSSVLSFMRKGEYIDIYFFKKKRKLFSNNIRMVGKMYQIKARYLENPVYYNFWGQEFKIPNNPTRVLRKLYGRNWKIPIANYHAPPNTIHIKIKKIMPSKIFNFLQSFKNKLK